MRIWLLDILACPICKHYPLELRIFDWETDEKTFSKLETAFRGRQLSVLEENCVLTLPNGKKDKCVKITGDGQVEIEDEFSREKKPSADYLRIVNEKIKSTQTIVDLTASSATRLLDLIRTIAIDDMMKAARQIGTQQGRTSATDQRKVVEGILPDIHILNWYFFLTEINEALISCGKCQRWYPVIETIPHMLPDDLRNDDEDVAFLRKWANKIPEAILSKGKPFNLKTQAVSKTEKRIGKRS